MMKKLKYLFSLDNVVIVLCVIFIIVVFNCNTQEGMTTEISDKARLYMENRKSLNELESLNEKTDNYIDELSQLEKQIDIAVKESDEQRNREFSKLFNSKVN